MRGWKLDGENMSLDPLDSESLNGEVKLKLSKVAVAASDIVYAANGGEHIPQILGHSAVAYVSEDTGDDLKLGSRVAISPYLTVKEHGEEVVKTMGVDVDGLLRDFVCVPSENVFPLPDGVLDEQVVFADYIAMGNKVFEALSCDRGDYVVIIGAGSLGLILAQLAMYYQMIPVLVDLDAEKLNIAKKLGVVYALNPTNDVLERRVEELTGGRLCDAAVFAGEGIGLNAALRLVKKEAEVIVAGYSFRQKHSVDMDTILKKQLKIKGVSNGEGEFSSAINLLANRIVKTDGMLTGEVEFEKFSHVVAECLKYPSKHNHILVALQ